MCILSVLPPRQPRRDSPAAREGMGLSWSRDSLASLYALRATAAGVKQQSEGLVKQAGIGVGVTQAEHK